MRETKAQRVERIKKTLPPLKVIDRIYEYASGKKIDPEDIDRMKWYGLYTQVGSDIENPLFMLRVKIPRGTLDSRKLQTLGEISIEYAKNSLALTTRQDVQFHNIKIEDLPQIFSRLSAVGLSSKFAAGDVVRNCVTCPLDGVSDSIDDTSDLVSKINETLCDRTFSNLPRKFKIGLSGCKNHCMPHEIQDLSFVATNHLGEILYAVYVGGGLGSNKRFADFIGYIRREQIVDLAKKIVKMYLIRGDRTDRKRARLGHMIERMGLESFLEQLSDFDLIIGKEPPITPFGKRHHCGFIENKNGSIHIGCSLFGGKLEGTRAIELANIMKRYRIDSLRLTTKQNFILCGVEKEKIYDICKDLEKIKINPFVGAFRTRTTACTGSEYCKFAIGETKEIAKELSLYLENRFPGFREPVTISVNGCPNSCAHPNIAQIALCAEKVKTENGVSVYYRLYLGGKLEGDKSIFAQKSSVLLKKEEINGFAEELVREYLKSGYETFDRFLSSYKSEITC